MERLYRGTAVQVVHGSQLALNHFYYLFDVERYGGNAAVRILNAVWVPIFYTVPYRHPQWTLFNIEVHQWVEDYWKEIFVYTFNVSGENSLGTLIGFQTANIEFFTSKRKVKGVKYIPGFGTDLTSNGSCTPTLLGALSDYANRIMDPLAYSNIRVQHGTWSRAGGFTPTTGFKINPTLGTQKRRNLR